MATTRGKPKHSKATPKNKKRSRPSPNSRATKGRKPASEPSRSNVPAVLRAHAAEVAALVPKDGKLYYRIGEVTNITGVKPYVLRYWESEFRWMSPQKSRSKQRLYRHKDIEMVLLIRRLLHQERYTIAGARKKLRDLGMGRALEEAAEEQVTRPAEPSELSHLDFYREVRGELQSIRDCL